MKNRTNNSKISFAFIYDGILGFSLLFFTFIVYYAFETGITQDLYQKLDTRAEMIANINFSKDQPILEIQEKFNKLDLLENQEVYLISQIHDQSINIPVSYKAPKSFIYKIMRSERATIHFHNRFYAGFLYKKDKGNYISIFSATDKRIDSQLSTLRKSLFISIILVFAMGTLLIHYTTSFIIKKNRSYLYNKWKLLVNKFKIDEKKDFNS